MALTAVSSLGGWDTQAEPGSGTDHTGHQGAAAPHRKPQQRLAPGLGRYPRQGHLSLPPDLKPTELPYRPRSLGLGIPLLLGDPTHREKWKPQLQALHEESHQKISHLLSEISISSLQSVS